MLKNLVENVMLRIQDGKDERGVVVWSIYMPDMSADRNVGGSWMEGACG